MAKKHKRKERHNDDDSNNGNDKEEEMTNVETSIDSKKKKKNKDEDHDDHDDDEMENEDTTEPSTTTKETSTEGSGGKRKRKRKRKKKTSEDDDDDNDNEEEEENDKNATGNNNNNNIKSSSVECTVYVEGIPFDATSKDVQEFFESHGSIPSKDIVELRLPTWQDSGRLRGYGHVLFASSKSYDIALSLSGKHLGKRYLTIQPSQAPKNGTNGNGSSSDSQSTMIPNPKETPPPEHCKTLFVTNLPYSATEQDIESVFSKFSSTGNTVEVRIARNSKTRQSKGFAYVDFESTDDVYQVVKAMFDKTNKNNTNSRGILIGGRLVRIDYDTGRIKGSFRTESGRLWTKEHSSTSTTTTKTTTSTSSHNKRGGREKGEGKRQRMK